MWLDSPAHRSSGFDGRGVGITLMCRIRVTHAVAAEILGCRLSYVPKLVRKGLLHASRRYAEPVPWWTGVGYNGVLKGDASASLKRARPRWVLAKHNIT